MSNKCMQIVGNNLQNINHIDLYNLQVSKYLEINGLLPLEQQAIKVFKDIASREKFTDLQYNKAVEDFNKNGFILRKKGVSYTNTAIDKNYNYINYPFLDREAVKETMSNYRQYIAVYNKQIKEENKAINKYNQSVFSNPTDKNKSLIKKFTAANNYLFNREYNVIVEEQNSTLDFKIYKKKRIQSIKFSSEIVFHTLLGFYVKQLKERNANQLQMNLSTSVDKSLLPKLKVNHRSLANHKIDGIARLDICKKTAQNHVKRLREAGLLTNYTYINQNHPIQIRFNTKILVILDGNTPKSQNTANQNINLAKEKSLHHNNDTTRTLLKRKEKKGNVLNIASLITGSMPIAGKTNSLAGSYKNTQEKATEKQKEVSPKNLSYVARISENFRNRLQDEQLFAKDLANGVYNNNKGLRYDYLKKVINYSNVSLEEFAYVLQQDVLKNAAKIWNKHDVYVGEWKKTINQIKTSFFKGLTTKEQMVSRLQEYRWKLNFARKWFLKNNRNALFPFKYFDQTRVKSGELGFFGLHTVWKSHLQYLQKRNKAEKHAKLDASKRQRILSNSKKLDRAISNFYSGKWNYDRLKNYVQDNLGNEYFVQLPMLIKNNTNFTA